MKDIENLLNKIDSLIKQLKSTKLQHHYAHLASSNWATRKRLSGIISELSQLVKEGK